jgi:hypothetical protein
MTRIVPIARMPVKDDVRVLEETVAHHIDLAGAPFFRGGAIQADGAGRPGAREPLLHRDGRERRRGSEEMMTARVSRALAGRGDAFRSGLLRNSRQRVEFGEYSDDRFARSETGDEGRRHACHAGLDRKSRLLQLLLEQGRAASLLVADLRVFPDLEGGFFRAFAVGLYGGSHVGFGILCRERHRTRPKDCCEHQPAHASSPLDVL